MSDLTRIAHDCIEKPAACAGFSISRCFLFWRITNNTDASTMDANNNACNNSGGMGANNAIYANNATCATCATCANDAIDTNKPFRRRPLGLGLPGRARQAPPSQGSPRVPP